MRDEGEGAEVVAWLSPWGHLQSIGQPPPPLIPLLKPMIDLGPLDLEGDLKNRWRFWGTPGEWEARSTTTDQPQFEVGQRNQLHGVTRPGSDYKSLINLGWWKAGGDAVEDVVNGGGGGMVGEVTMAVWGGSCAGGGRGGARDRFGWVASLEHVRPGTRFGGEAL